MTTVHFIGCGVLGLDLRQVAAALNLELHATFLPAGLHDKPWELHARLQETIDVLSPNADCTRIVIGYGLCGQGTVSIRAARVPLIFAKVHDCIALFLGSDQAYRDEFVRHPGTFYVTAGWQQAHEERNRNKDESVWIGSESMGCQDLRRQYGERGGQKIIDFFSSWRRNYTRAAFIDTGIPREKAEAQTREMAAKNGWAYEQLRGNDSLLQKLLTQLESDSDILVVPPHHTTIYSARSTSLDCVPDVGDAVQRSSIEEDAALHSRAVLAPARNPSIRYGLGVDAGGTYTDAVIFDFSKDEIDSKHKALTTKWDFAVGIDNALAGLDQELLGRVQLVSLSTTLATNAIVEGQGQKVGLLVMNNLAGAAEKIPSYHNPQRNIRGLIDITGQERQPIDENEVREAVNDMVRRSGVCGFAVSGFGASVNPTHELQVKKIIAKETGMAVCCGHELSDLLDFSIRAQTAVLNARIIPLMIRFFKDIERILQKRKISAPLMVVKGDGSLISVDMAKERPVETIMSGPAASVAGARILTGLDDALVVDMGGTTSDIAEIRDGAVAVCRKGARVGGFATHVKALDMWTCGLGGDSLIRWRSGKWEIGPTRVFPLSYAGSLQQEKLVQALSCFLARTVSHLAQVIYFLPAPPQPDFSLTPAEQDIVDQLTVRPHSPEELARALGKVSCIGLVTARLEEYGIIQKSGLTPTDLLHLSGDYLRWSPESARHMVRVLSESCGREEGPLVQELLAMVRKSLALELFRHQVSKDRGQRRPGRAGDLNQEEREDTFLNQHFIETLFDPLPGARFSLKIKSHLPLIGVGAPISYFLPQAADILQTSTIIPTDGDVANALGAITSRIVLQQKVIIRPDGQGQFIVEGVAGTRKFSSLESAHHWATEYLGQSLRTQAVAAGTDSREVACGIDDRIVRAANGVPLFLERVLGGTLTGYPELRKE